MRNLRWAVTLWPGLAHLWMRGSWFALGLACSFAFLVNLLLLATFLWTEWLPGELVLGGWSLVAVSWCVTAWLSRRLYSVGAEEPIEESPEAEDLFRQAQSQYLQGNWFDAEALLSELLKRNRADVEARLMMATLLGHTGREQEAEFELDLLSRMDAADRWSVELNDLRQRLENREEERTVEAA